MLARRQHARTTPARAADRYEDAAHGSDIDTSEAPYHLDSVLIVTDNFPGRGGVETVVANLASAFRADGIHVQIVSLLPGRRESTSIEPAIIFRRRPHLQRQSILGEGRRSFRSIVRLPLLAIKRWDRLRGLRILRTIVLKQPPGSLVIATSPRVATYLQDAGALSAAGRPPVVAQYHLPFQAQVNLEGRGLPVSRSIEVDAFIALSYDDVERFSAELGVQCYNIGNPLPPRRQLAESNDRSGRVMQTVRMDYRVVALCRLSGEKQLDVMIDCFLRATHGTELSMWNLEIFGEGAEREALEAQIAASAEAAGRVRLMGWTDDAFTSLEGASLLLSTSSFEAFGMNIVEAARTGVPTLAFGCSPGLVDLVTYLGGELASPNDGDAFTAKMRELLSNPDELERLGRISREKSVRFDSSEVVSDWIRVAASLHERLHATGKK